MRDPTRRVLVSAALVTLLAGCGDTPQAPEIDRSGVDLAAAPSGSSFEFAPPVFDISAAPDGSILVAEFTTIKEISKSGVSEVALIPTVAPSAINGLETVGRGSFFATSEGQDLAVGAGVWHVTRGGTRLVGDIEAFETERDPDAFEGLEWKDQACEASGPFSAGPQSNPYHLTTLSGSTALIADAAGNTILSASKNGSVDWVAILTPPTADGSGSADPADWLVLFPLNAATNCYVQPVPTSLALGSDGAVYVGELTGLTPANFGGVPSPGLSRVWRIAPGARHVTCPSPDCEVVISGLTSVIDLSFGPDGALYVLEYDENGWAVATGVFAPPAGAGGTLNRCNVPTGSCVVVASGLVLPGAITFDKWGGPWLLENNIGIPPGVLGLGAGPSVPTVRRMSLP